MIQLMNVLSDKDKPSHDNLVLEEGKKITFFTNDKRKITGTISVLDCRTRYMWGNFATWITADINITLVDVTIKESGELV